MTRWLARYAWLGGESLAPNVLLEVRAGRFTRVDPIGPNAERGRGAAVLDGVVLPGLVNAHSHAFQRALRGRTHAVNGDFWSWRDAMYRAAAQLEPDRYQHLAHASFLEMLAAGITHVGEFHYLHHAPGGGRYPDPNAMGMALCRAAADAGIRLTLIDSCYLQGGLDGAPLEDAQLRFGDGSAAAWTRRVRGLARLLDGAQRVCLGLAAHSVRAVPAAALGDIAELAAELGTPLHVHASEQPAENDACAQATGRTPIELLAESGFLQPHTTLIHTTHASPSDVARLAGCGSRVCLCPTTERDLADGIGVAAELAAAGVELCVGSDSNARTDLFEEARAIELDDRLRTGRRGLHPPAQLLEAITHAGARALAGEANTAPEGLAEAAPADFILLDLDSPRLADLDPVCGAAQLVFCADASDVRDVVIGGEAVISNRRHRSGANTAERLRQSTAALWEAGP